MPAWKTLVETLGSQVYISRSLDPFLNLSIEHFLLQKSPPHSTVLFLYVNRPCVVIGRNQNPWLETDLELLRQRRAAEGYHAVNRVYSPSHRREKVELVRRRSGGGTVFHDEGNVNYSVICPTADFTRDKHAEMVTRAIRKTTLRARVNERHDIVLDQGDTLPEEEWPHPLDMHRTRFRPEHKDSVSLKVSGSAYKMTRQRSLHHGTCLLASADLPGVSRLLSSRARPYIKARGVDSVRSPIGNIYGESEVSHQNFNKRFQIEVVRAFTEMYKLDRIAEEFESNFDSEHSSAGGSRYLMSQVGQGLEEIEEIRAGVAELKSSKWIYGQTPQFTLSSHAIEDDERERPALPEDFPENARVFLKVKSGVIISTNISVSSDSHSAKEEAEMFNEVLEGRYIHEIHDFGPLLSQARQDESAEVSSISRWLNEMFGN